MLEVTGVETSSDYKALIAVGAERICTSHAEEIHAELMKEAENFSLAVDLSSSADLSSSTSSVPSKESGTPSEIKTQPIEKPIAKAEQMSVLGDKKLLNGVLK
jgi:hypothetical protein